MRLGSALVAVLGLVTLNGCVSSRIGDLIDSDANSLVMAGTTQVITNVDGVAKVNLAETIRRYSNCGSNGETGSSASATVDQALSDFRRCSSRDQVGARSSIQRYIMMVADRRCEVYKQTVSEIDSSFSMGFGALSTVTGVLGGLFTDAAQGLAATAGISSGLSAEFSKAFFKSTAMPVIFAGIDMKRQQIAAHIDSMKDGSLSEYPLEAAISDAIRYNGACSAVEGMKQVQDSIAGSAGIDAANQTIRSVSATKQLLAISKMPAPQMAAALKTFVADQDATGPVAKGKGKEADGSPSWAPAAIDDAQGRVNGIARKLDAAMAQVEVLTTRSKALDVEIKNESDVEKKKLKQADKESVDNSIKVRMNEVDSLDSILSVENSALVLKHKSVAAIHACLSTNMSVADAYADKKFAYLLLSGIGRPAANSLVRRESMDALIRDVGSLDETGLGLVCNAMSAALSSCKC